MEIAISGTIRGTTGTYTDLVYRARGGTSSVYRARRVEDDTRWAIKMLNIYQFAPGVPYCTDAAARQQFAHEAAILSRLDHPQIPHLEEALTLANDCPALIMGYVDGTDLAHLLHKNKLTTAEALDYGAQLCAIVDELHHAAPPVSMNSGKPLYVLGDIPRGNVLIDGQGRVALCDFGEASAQTELDMRAVAMLVLIMLADDIKATPEARVQVVDPEARAVLETALAGGYTDMAAFGGALRSYSPDP